MAQALDEVIAELYGVDPRDFTSARNELARRLRSSGDAEAARRVAALKKPVIAAWAVNQLARRRPEEIRALVEQRTADSAEELRTLAKRRRQVLNSLVAGARTVLEGAGHTASPGLLQRIARTLEGAAQNEPEALERGTLHREQEPAADLLGSGMVVAEEATAEDDDRSEEVRLLLEEADRAEGAASELTEAAVRAEAEARRAADLAAEARKQARAARERAQSAARRTRTAGGK